MEPNEPRIGGRVLLVEAEMPVARSIEDAILEVGFEVIGPVTRVERVLAMLDTGQLFDAAVMDLDVGGQTALPIADLLAGYGIPFLVLTGGGAVALPERHRHAPVLPKPIEAAQLSQALWRLLDPDAPTPPDLAAPP
jgi:DNA-binding response OmpR family regulator